MSDRSGDVSNIVGPWVAHDDDGSCWAVKRQPETEGYWKGEMGFGLIYPLPGHHARLIAAAPELLEALEWLRDNPLAWTLEPRESLAFVESVIAKARGE